MNRYGMLCNAISVLIMYGIILVRSMEVQQVENSTINIVKYGIAKHEDKTNKFENVRIKK